MKGVGGGDGSRGYKCVIFYGLLVLYSVWNGVSVSDAVYEVEWIGEFREAGIYERVVRVKRRL